MLGVTTIHRDGWWPEDQEHDPNTYSGVNISPESSLQLTAVWACRRVLAETIASLPLAVFERDRTDPRRKTKIPDHHLYPILHDEPNPEMDSYQWRLATVDSMTGWGNGYSQIEMDGADRPLALWPLHPTQIMQSRRASGSIAYTVITPGQQNATLLPKAMWHPMIMPALTADGLLGRSPIMACRQAIGLSLGAERYGAELFANDARSTGILEFKGKLGRTREEAKAMREEIRAAWNDSARHSVRITDQESTFKPMSIPPDDAQFLETRKFQLSEIARIYGMIPQLIGDTEKSTTWGTGIEQLSIAFVVFTLRPWLVALEQSLNRVLFSREEKKRYLVEFNIDALLRGDLASRYSAYQAGRQWGWLSANEIRALENQNPIVNGDIYLQPLNMVPAGTPPPPPKGLEEGGNPDRFVRALGVFGGETERILQEEHANGNHR